MSSADCRAQITDARFERYPVPRVRVVLPPYSTAPLPTAESLDFLSPQSVEGIEVRGVSTIPPQFMGAGTSAHAA
jgi:hypothetical protein